MAGLQAKRLEKRLPRPIARGVPNVLFLVFVCSKGLKIWDLQPGFKKFNLG
jgi:hypothetical protein